MKFIQKISWPLLFLFVFASCKNNNGTDTRDVNLLSDSSAYNNNLSSDSVKQHEVNTAENGSSYRYHQKKSSNNEQPTDEKKSSSESGTVSNSTQSNSTKTTEKKGWSKAAQGAVIGGATGAVGGAIISKHKGTGAAIGAAAGAVGGYIIGNEKDKKDGRKK